MDRTFAITIAWFILLFTSTKVAAEIVIHEIHYNPAERGQALEFIELLNHGEKSINLSGWKFDQGISFTFPANTPPLAPGGLLVVAEDPAQVKEVYQTEAVGPWEGKLSNRGETLTLRNAQGKKVDEVAYGVGFPWPATAAGGGASMELIHPNLDNNLAGSWRSSIPSAPAPASKSLVAAASTSWRYFKGTQEPPPRWLTIDFDDAAWLQCQTPIGYADEDDHTVLGDMLGKYSTVYLRHVFQIPSDQSLDRPLALRIYSDDGALVWLNGIEVGRLRVADPQPNHRSQTTQNHEATWETITLEQPWRVLRPGKNVLAVLGVNGSTTSSDFSIDAELSEATESSMLAVPSPGTANRSALGMPPPQIRQVDHEPRQPRTGQSVVISAKVTDPDGLAKVTLLYQKLRPGHYIAKSDAGYETEWQERDMVPQESVFTAEIPGPWQQHRHLLRYRILAEDKTGARITVPYADDEQSNFAYYTYDGAPSWTGADRPGHSDPHTFSEDLMNQVPIMHLIAHGSDVENSQYNRRYNEQFLTGTLIVGTTVYDHIQFRNRGETTTYAVGKNKWRINFNRTRELPAHTLDGNLNSNSRLWKRLNLNPGTAPYHPSFRGNASLNERIAFRLYQLAGIPAPDTCYAQLRVIDDAEEAGADQYTGDLWGLYMPFEAIDGFLLDNNNEPDGELVRIKQGGNTIARTAVMPAPEGMDYPSFWRAIQQPQSAEWWEQQVDLERYFSFHAISIATARIDQKLNHNHYLYHHPDRGWQALPWDTDLCLRPVVYDPDNDRWQTMLKFSLEHERHRIAYQNRGRELLDLLFTKEQIDPLVDELVKDLGPLDGQASFADVDRFLWNYHPRTESEHRGSFLQKRIRRQSISGHESSAPMIFDTDTFAERVRYFKDYLTDTPASPGKDYRGWGYRQLHRDVRDLDSPLTPTIQRISGSDSLTFQAGAFKDLQGPKTFGGIRWRIAPLSELVPLWESPFLDTDRRTFTFPLLSLIPGELYRVRARFIDTSGRASHWSAPVEITAAAQDATIYKENLVISEIMYHPANEHAPEFIELMNVGKETLNLAPLQFTKGIDFDFSKSTLQSMLPGARVLVVDDMVKFRQTHPDQIAAVAGAWNSSSLANKGERITLSVGAHSPFLSFTYNDAEPWPSSADGDGYSLELKAPTEHSDPNLGTSWQASAQLGGSPGS